MLPKGSKYSATVEFVLKDHLWYASWGHGTASGPSWLFNEDNPVFSSGKTLTGRSDVRKLLESRGSKQLHSGSSSNAIRPQTTCHLSRALCIYIYICICIQINIYIYICMYMYIYICMCIYIYICIRRQPAQRQLCHGSYYPKGA